MSSGGSRIALITGASQGLGLETARALARQGMSVIVTGRSPEKLATAKADLDKDGTIFTHELDVADQASVDRLFAWLKTEFGRLDVLVNNAGRIYPDLPGRITELPASTVLDAINNNSMSAYRMIQQALPMMNDAGHGRIVNLSSGLGALSDMGGGTVAYRITKTAMNAITRIASNEARGDVKINSVCPGWVRTNMGGASAPRSLEQGIGGIVWAATLPASGPNGGFFRDGKPIDW
ncbi:MAG: SDR family NAD(P)-dependent oxidoreductase [Hyphomicrobiaceae bacterium]|nr:SDR family NAD(P)-dependent oxidoreductase [Hyphomicrobiaceae bacterium]MCC0023854.1 SDR family NAD(P)-dependent oxidoreductase [Hyphomicrobiaceae bacterium]